AKKLEDTYENILEALDNPAEQHQNVLKKESIMKTVKLNGQKAAKRKSTWSALKLTAFFFLVAFAGIALKYYGLISAKPKLLPPIKPPPKEYLSVQNNLANDKFSQPATIIVHATHLNISHFTSYVQSGYNITVNSITNESMFEFASSSPNPCPGLSWISEIGKHETGQYFYSHLTDYLRFCILYKHGGIYSDFDAIQLMRWPRNIATLSHGTAFIGIDSATGAPPQRLGHPSPVSMGPRICPWCLENNGVTYLAPGVMGASAGHALVRLALEIGFDRAPYDARVFNAVGPKAVTLAYKELKQVERSTRKKSGVGVELLERNTLYPYSYLDSWKVFKRIADGEAAAESLVRKGGVSLHLYGHKTKGMDVEEGSILDYLIRKHTIVKNNFEEIAVRSASHQIKAPRFLGISKYIQEVPDVRIFSHTWDLHETSVIKIILGISVTHGKIRIASKSKFEWHSSIKTLPITPAAANVLLSGLVYFAQNLPDSNIDELQIKITDVTTQKSSTTQTRTIPIYNLPNLITIMVKTTNRMSKVFSLVTSSLELYPNLTIMVSDDGHIDPRKTTRPEGQQRGFYYLPLSHDVGLSAARNIMVDRIRTKYVLTLDDDFILTPDSDIAALIHALETPPKFSGGNKNISMQFSEAATRFEIAAGKIPADESRFGVDYCGVMHATAQGTLRLDAGRAIREDASPEATHEGCTEVEFVPNVFVARTAFLRDILRWDPLLKLGEHEDFFWRAKNSAKFFGGNGTVVNAVRVLTCPHVSFFHDQVEHWKGNTEYDRKRARVYDFWKLALRKHRFNRLVSFGRIVMDLKLPQPIENLRVSEILARSVTLTWISPAASFKILQSADYGISWAPINHGQGENYEHVPHRVSNSPDGFERPAGSENWITVHGLIPGHKFFFRIHAGNRFSYLEGGVTAEVTTLQYSQEAKLNLIENPSFESQNTEPYEISPKNTYKLVPIISVKKSGLEKIRGIGFRSEITTVGYLSPNRSIASLSQFIPGEKFRRYRSGSKIIISAQSRIDALFDFEDGMSWRINVKVWFSNLSFDAEMSEISEGSGRSRDKKREGTKLEWGTANVEEWTEFDRTNTGWQGRTVVICVGRGWMERIRGVEVTAVLETFRGSVTWDEFVGLVSSTIGSRNIFVAVDESAHSVAAFNWVLDNIKLAPGDTVTAVVGIDSEDQRESATHISFQTLERIKSLIRAIADPDHLSFRYAVQLVVAPGTFGPKLVALVSDAQPDLLVLGSAGKSHLEGLFVGSVSHYALVNANVPVIVARLTPADEARAQKNAAKSSSLPFDHAMWI
ncbi:Beta-1,4 N-acetylgalactosaminyltransferase 1, partial [Physocladia obscura]